MSTGLYDHLERVHAPRQERTRKAFVDALDTFDELLRSRPYAEVGMQDVADRAGLSITSVYARFDGKAALVLALHERTIAQGLDGLDALAHDPAFGAAPLEDAVRTIIGASVAFADTHRHVFRAVIAAGDAETNERAAAFIRGGSERLALLLSPKLSTDAETAARDIDFAWRATLAVLQQSWMLGDAQPTRFPLTDDQLVHRLTQQFLAAVDHRRP